eukprot:scaffold12308_cov74-Cyclotella_meneghiniana.AAC.15
MNMMLNIQGRFHNNKVNRAIHFVFIPIIQFTLFILGAMYWHQTKFEFLQVAVPEGNICVETWLLFVIVMISYFFADWRTASVTLLWSGAQLIASQYIALHQNLVFRWNDNAAFKLGDIVLYLHILAWLAQFYGHGVHEGRAPALTTNLLFAGLAPFFVTFEFLNEAFGYKEDEMKAIRKKIADDIDEYRRHKNGKKYS